jgi:hypothetical protein
VKGGKRAAIQDGSRQWVTVLASICADETTLPPGIIYDGKNGNIRDTWVHEISEEKHQVFVASSDSGWTNDDLGLAWLRDVFDRSTKEKCRRSFELSRHNLNTTSQTPCAHYCSLARHTGTQCRRA